MSFQCRTKQALIPLASIATAILVLVAFGVHVWRSTSFFYDDAYMFYRYAYNLHHFHAIEWNAGGPHTYGTTSLPWMVIVTAFSYLPLSPTIVLSLASTLFFIAAVVLLAYVLSKNARSPIFQNFWHIFPALLLSLIASGSFLHNVIGGMETMLSLLANSILCFLVWKVVDGNSENRIILALSGGAFFAYLVRPESGICDLLTPTLAIFLLGKQNRLSRIALFGSVASGLILLQILACKMYFGSALPLSFYAKSTHISPVVYKPWPHNFYNFFGLAVIYLAIIFLVGHKKHLRLLVAFFLSPFLTFLYLSQVTQLTGEYSRYYCPFLPYFIIPAFILLDEYLHAEIPISTREFIPRFFMVAVIVSFATQPYGGEIVAHLTYLELRAQRENGYSTMRSFVPPNSTLPEMPWKQDLIGFSNDVACDLPVGVKIAAGEDGYLSAQCQHLDIVDMSGLNDTVIAHTGFSANYILKQHPDIIWMPNPVFFIHWYHALFMNPQFQQQYDFIPGAFNFGMAIRKDSPYRPQILAVLRHAWPKYYPNTCIAPICETPVSASLGKNPEPDYPKNP